MSNSSIYLHNAIPNTSSQTPSPNEGEKELVNKINKLFKKENYLSLIQMYSREKDSVTTPELKKEILVLNNIAECELVKQINKFLEDGRFFNALRTCTEFLTILPEDRGVLELRRQAQWGIDEQKDYDRGDFEKVVEDCDRYISASILNPTALAIKNKALYHQIQLEGAQEALKNGKLHLALTLLLETLKEFPDHPKAREIASKATVQQHLLRCQKMEREETSDRDLSGDTLESKLSEAHSLFEHGEFSLAAIKIEEILKYPNLSQESILLYLGYAERARTCQYLMQKVNKHLNSHSFSKAQTLLSEVLNMPPLFALPESKKEENDQPTDSQLDRITELFEEKAYEEVMDKCLSLRLTPLSSDRLEKCDKILSEAMILHILEEFKAAKFESTVALTRKFLELFPFNSNIEDLQRKSRYFLELKRAVDDALKHNLVFLAHCLSEDLRRCFPEAASLKDLHQLPLRIYLTNLNWASYREADWKDSLGIWLKSKGIMEEFYMGSFESVIQLYEEAKNNNVLSENLAEFSEKAKHVKELVLEFMSALKESRWDTAESLKEQIIKCFKPELIMVSNPSWPNEFK